MIVTEKDVIEMDSQPIVQIWKNSKLVKTLYMNANWFLSVFSKSKSMMDKRPYIAKFGYIEIAIVDIAEFTDERRQPCTEK